MNSGNFAILRRSIAALDSPQHMCTDIHTHTHPDVQMSPGWINWSRGPFFPKVSDYMSDMEFS